MLLRKNNRGFTVVEAMVAMALGLVLVGIMLAVFSSTRHSYMLQDGLTRVQEDGRIAMHLIAEEVRKAGFRKPVWNDPMTGYSPLTSSSANGASGANDTLQIMYMDDTSCLGVVNAAFDPETTEPMALYKRVTFTVDNTGNLIWSCEYGPSPTNLTQQRSNQVIIDNVESFQVLYGIDTDFPPDFSINAWTTVDNITPESAVCLQSQYLCEAGGLINGMLSGVPVALQIGMLISSPHVTGTDVESQSFTILDVAVAAQNDNVLRKAYATTVNLRNLTL